MTKQPLLPPSARSPALQRLLGYLGRLPKWRLFWVLVTTAAVIAAIISTVVYLTVLDGTTGSPVRLALIAPMSGENQGIGRSMREGVAQWIADTSKHGGLAGHPVDVLVIDEAAHPDAAETAAADHTVIGVIGPYGSQAAARARPVLEAAGLPALTLGDPGRGDAAGRQTVFPLASRPGQEVQFLANYVRNVLGERLVSIVLADDDENRTLADGFDAVLQRFGTKVVYRWAIKPGATADLKPVIAEFVDKKIAGTVLVLGSPSFAAEAASALRGANVPNRIVGTRAIATNAFREKLEGAWSDRATVDVALNGIIATTPVLFDTAGIAAQTFRDHVVAATERTPDWAAVLSHDAAAGFGTALAAVPGAATGTVAELRDRLRGQLATYDSADHALNGLAGAIFFDRGGGASLPELVGTFDGAELVAALIQLSPIRGLGVSDYLDELTSGRALYVNDRFMYKTNVVYTGIQLEKVFELNPATNIADLEFVVWFRWRGTLEPQNIIFPNAVGAVKLGAPDREGKVGDLNYRAYRVRGKFYMNASNERHRFGTQAIEIQFHNRTLAANNLMFVTDELGMGLSAEKKGKPSAPDDWLHRLLGIQSATGALTKELTEGRVLAGVSGWLVERAWISQDLRSSSSSGDPVFVGFGKPLPVFSTINLGLVAKADALDLDGVVPKNWMVYLAILALSLAILARLLDQKNRGQFWRIQSLLLRVFAWPVLLLAMSAVLLDSAQDTLTPNGLRFISYVSQALWWLIPARLLLIAVERFLWVPLEHRTERNIPTVFRMFVTVFVYVVAGFGIVAFVLGQTITSLLATSGVLTLIIGLAIQSNLRDVISGIMLNLERPFVIGDYLWLNKRRVKVIDVSWRTTRMQNELGAIIALPNGKMSDSEIENATRQNKYRVQTTVMLDPHYDPDVVVEALRTAGTSMPLPLKVKYVAFVKIEAVKDAFTAVYSQTLEVPDYETSKEVRDTAMAYIWRSLRAAGVEWTSLEQGLSAERNRALESA